MATFTITLPSEVEVLNGKQITFRAPADNDGITGIIVNDVTYDLVDTANNSISACVNVFKSGSLVSVIMDTENAKAIVQRNAAVPPGLDTHLDNTTAHITASERTAWNNKIGSVFFAGTTAPVDTRLLWIDTNETTGGLKYYNGSTWVGVPVQFT